jgi:addiction module RelE/StbE family toxin
MSKRLRWLSIALDDLEQAVEYLAQYNLSAAHNLANRIYDAVKILEENPEAGRPGRVAGTRELVVSGTSYIVPYRIRDGEIQLLRVLHGARRWPVKFRYRD